MTLSKKEKLIRSLKELEEAKLSSIIRLIGKRDFSKVSDLNATLTQIIYTDVISRYPDIMANPKSDLLRKFCVDDVGAIKSEATYKPTPKIKR